MAARKKVTEPEMENSESVETVETVLTAETEENTSPGEIGNPDGDSGTFPDLDELEDTQVQETESSEDEETTSALRSILGSLPPEQRKEFADLVNKISFRGHSIAKATKQQMREMLRDEENIHAMDGSYKSDAKKLKEDMIELAASATTGRILTGKIFGISDIESNSEVKQYKAKVRFGNGTCKVLIPDFVLFNFDYSKRLDPDVQKKVKRRMQSMLGAEIDFVVKHWDAKTKTAYGDHIKAMEKNGWHNYLNPQNYDVIKPGMLVEAKIIAVRVADLIVSAKGVDARIPMGECGWAHYIDLRDVFKVGQSVVAKVLNISQKEVEKAGGERYNLVGLELSIRQASKDPREKYWHDYKENDVYIASVTGVDPAGNGVFLMLDNKVQALAAYPTFGAIPEVGDDVTVQITEKVIVQKNDGTKEYRIFCILKRK